MQADAQGRSEIRLTLAVENPQLWSPETPHLYDLELQLVDASAQLIDQVHSYTGLRELTVSSGQHCLNGKPLYLRGILDQGYFPEGWYSPADDQAIQQDIELTKAMGFNFARKHQKAEDPRYLYWADKMGLLVWAEMPSGRIFSTELITSLTTQWLDQYVEIVAIHVLLAGCPSMSLGACDIFNNARNNGRWWMDSCK